MDDDRLKMYLITDDHDFYDSIDFHSKINDGLNIVNMHLCYFRNVFCSISCGKYLRKVRLPVEHPDFKIIDDHINMIIVEDRYSLSDLKTWIMMRDLGFNFHSYNNPENLLYWASSYGYIEIIKFFISLNFNMRINNVALNQASKCGYLDIVKLLISLGADIRDINCALHSACEEGKIEVAKFLISLGADIHSSNEYALRFAVYNGHIEVAKLLISFGSNVHVSNDCLLHLAFKNKPNEIFQLLISLGLKPPANNRYDYLLPERIFDIDFIDLIM